MPEVYTGVDAQTGPVSLATGYYLRAGGSMPPYQLLKSAGVEMATPQPFQALNKRMNAIMDEMEVLLAVKVN
ncbi:MAG: hypothetical protein LH481_02380 [Burkholderiales bacterium]|nr:hypothetical protein [Burkholderiales bacterium]